MAYFPCFPGALALSAFRQRRLPSTLKCIDPDTNGASVQYLYFVAADTPPSADESVCVQALLTYGSPAPADVESDRFVVIPRFGTISPWVSKATEAARHCVLSQTHRIERGVEFVTTCKKGLTRSLTGVAKRLDDATHAAAAEHLYDHMTEMVIDTREASYGLSDVLSAKALRFVDIVGDREAGRRTLEVTNVEMGLALSNDEIDYLIDTCRKLECNPANIELMTFAQANDEYCRHKIFSADWTVNGEMQDKSLFAMIHNTCQLTSQDTVVTYSNNAAVMEGGMAEHQFSHADVESETGVPQYDRHEALTHILMKVEMHNYPTVISPFPGASIGAGSEVQDKGTINRGVRPKAGPTGLTVSNLLLPEALQSWESARGTAQPVAHHNPNEATPGSVDKPDRITSPLQIMIEGPIGSAAFNGEFSRLSLDGYFHVYRQSVGGTVCGYHKPIMIVDSIGNIDAGHTYKHGLSVGMLLIQLGGPGMHIGMGGDAANSIATGANNTDLNSDSIQRDNPETQRHAQRVTDACQALGEDNPILSIHDVGADGISNAFPELVDSVGGDTRFGLCQVHLEESDLSPTET